MLKKVNLDSQALEYIVDELSQGRELAKAVLLNTFLQKGKLFTYSPEKFDIREMDDLGESISYLSDEYVLQPFREIIGREIVNYCNESESHIAIFETLGHVPVPPSLEDPGIRYFSIKGNKYDYIVKDFVQSIRIERYLIDSSIYPTVIVLTTLPFGITIQPYQEIDEDLITSLATNANKIIIGAFDGEGYVIWEK